MGLLGNTCDEGIRSLPAAANQVFSVGDFVMLKNGYCIVGAVTTGAKVIGTCAKALDTTGLSAGDEKVFFNVGDYRPSFDVANSGADPIAQADCGVAYCYVSGAYEVAKTSGGSTRSVAGLPLRVKENGKVEVAILPMSVLP
jgi:hypothetical protein